MIELEFMRNFERHTQIERRNSNIQILVKKQSVNCLPKNGFNFLKDRRCSLILDKSPKNTHHRESNQESEYFKFERENFQQKKPSNKPRRSLSNKKNFQFRASRDKNEFFRS